MNPVRIILTACLATLVLLSSAAYRYRAAAVARNAYGAAVATTLDTLRVCSDPNNLPFSNRAGQGFENKIIERIAAELRVPLAYTWWAQRRGFIRSTVSSGLCDVVVGTPSSIDLLLTTRSYYRSSYVFVSRHDRKLNVQSFDDDRLKHFRIGVQLIGDDFANTPPAHALAARGITRNLVGYTVYGDYREANPATRIVNAVANGEVDVAVVWGPMAGYAARLSNVALDLVPVLPHIDSPYLPFVFDIAMGVRRGDTTFRAQLDDAIVHEKPAIDSILRAYHVPRLDSVPHMRDRQTGDERLPR